MKTRHKVEGMTHLQDHKGKYISLIAMVEGERAAITQLEYRSVTEDSLKKVFHFYEIPEEDLRAFSFDEKREIINKLRKNPPQLNKWNGKEYL